MVKFGLIVSTLIFSVPAFSSFGESMPKVNVDFDTLQEKLINSSKAKQVNQKDVYEYVLSYKNGDAKTLYENRWNRLRGDGYDTAIKELVIETLPSSSGYRPPYIKYSCNLIEYKGRGKSRGQYTASITLFRAEDGTTLVAADQDHSSPAYVEDPIKQDVNLVVSDDKIIAEYKDSYKNDSNPIDIRLVIKLNQTVDCEIEAKTINMSNYKKIGYYYGGRPEGIIRRGTID